MALVTINNFSGAVEWLRQQAVVCIDTETTGLRPFHGDQLVGISVGKEDQTFYYPFRHEIGENLSEDKLHILMSIIQTRDTLILHNSKFDLHMLIRDGFVLPGHYPRTKDCPILDTLLGMHLINENEKKFALKALCDRYRIGTGSKDEEDLRGIIVNKFRKEIAEARSEGAEQKGSLDKMWKGFMWKLSPEEVSAYAEADVYLTWHLLVDLIWPHLEGWGMVGLFHEVCNYNLLLTKMEERGVQIDKDRLVELTKRVEREANLAEYRLWEATGIQNCNASRQCINYFGVKSTQEMLLKHDLMLGNVRLPNAERDVALLLNARGKRKVVDSYFIPYNRYLAQDGAIHPSLKIHGTATGRLSCSDPNLQALPRDVTDQPAKAVFVARPGYVLVEIDLSQAELRVASHFAAQIAESHSDPGRFLEQIWVDNDEYFEEGVIVSKMGAVLAKKDSDLHTETMESMQKYNPTFDRNIAKRINLSAIFGIGSRKFSQTYAVPLHQSEEALAVWRKIYPEFSLFYNAALQIATDQKHIKLPLSGRLRRYTTDGVSYPSKASSNWVQGTVADVMRISMHEADEFLTRSAYGFLLLQVHDSLLLEIREEYVYEATAEVQRIMTDFDFHPRLRTDAKIGYSWGDMKPKESRHDTVGDRRSA